MDRCSYRVGRLDCCRPPRATAPAHCGVAVAPVSVAPVAPASPATGRSVGRPTELVAPAGRLVPGHMAAHRREHCHRRAGRHRVHRVVASGARGSLTSSLLGPSPAARRRRPAAWWRLRAGSGQWGRRRPTAR